MLNLRVYENKSMHLDFSSTIKYMLFVCLFILFVY